MKIFLTALIVATGAAASISGQGKFVGIDDDPQLGDAKAKVTIIEFGDYQCPSCRMFWKDVEPRLRKEYVDTGKVRLVFRDFPIVEIHPEAMVASIAAQCANDQGKYWEMHDKIFREQYNKGDEIIRFKVADLKKWAKDLKLDAAAFDSCVDAEKYKAEVAKDKADGDAVGIQGTPSFFINGRFLGGVHPYPDFKKMIDEELAK